MAKYGKKLTIKPTQQTEEKNVIEERVFTASKDYFDKLEEKLVGSVYCKCGKFFPEKLVGANKVRKAFAIYQYRICWQCKCGLYCSRSITICHVTLG